MNKPLRWMKLDNAAKIYPAARRRGWSNVFRLSATLIDPVDVGTLQAALDCTVRRFPSVAVRLRRGMFWYYLQQLPEPPTVTEDYSYPLTNMDKRETRECALRVLVYDRRVAVELFHSITDGNGALVFLKTLLAEYCTRRYGVLIPAECGVLDREEAPDEAELEDSFLRYAAKDGVSRKETKAWQMTGTPELSGLLHITCLKLSVAETLQKAREYGVSLTAFLTAAMMMALQNYQRECVQKQQHRKPIKVLIPVDLRRLFDSRSLRNFALYTTPEILPRQGEYTFEEICRVVHHHMGTEITRKKMATKMASNVKTERSKPIRVVPLFIKNAVMKAVFDAVGECQSCLTLSNLGAVRLPETMMPFVERMDFILGVQSSSPYNCGVLSFKDTLYINMIRNIRESSLEYHFYRVLREQGLCVEAESNLSALSYIKE